MKQTTMKLSYYLALIIVVFRAKARTKARTPNSNLYPTSTSAIRIIDGCPEWHSLDFIRGSIGSYPNLFITVNYDDLPDFFDLMQNYDRSSQYDDKIRKYFVNRADTDFWQTYDWFQNHFNESDPLQAGLYDLNRYFGKSW